MNGRRIRAELLLRSRVSSQFQEIAHRSLRTMTRMSILNFRRMGHNYIGTEHVLLALLELEDGTGVLAGLGIDKATAEANITAAVAATLAAHEQKGS